MNDEHEIPGLSAQPQDEHEDAAGGMSRREALATLGKHAAYTAPAVLALLTSQRAAASPGGFYF